jgi:serine protease SohB
VNVGVRLTVCIDELAASGGYLMACIADHIVCSPYAAVGSIGVVAQQPNVAERLEREGIEFITTTAGKWKRTVCVVCGPAPTRGPTLRPVSL